MYMKSKNIIFKRRAARINFIKLFYGIGNYFMFIFLLN